MNKYKKDESLSYGIGVFIVKSDDGVEMEIALPDKTEIKTGYELILVIDGEEKKFIIQKEITRVGETILFREI